MAILDNNVIHMHGLKFGEAFREGNQVSRFMRAVKLEEIRFGYIWVPSPPEFGQPLLEFGIGPYDLVGWKVDEDSGASPRGGGSAWMGRVLALEGLPGWVGYETSHAIFVEHPNAGHGSRERDRRGGERKRERVLDL